MIRIIPYEEKYRDDMIFMILEAKNALGRIPSINRDLLDIPGKYLSRGDEFWVALDEHDRVIGSVGYNRLDDDNARMHRLYVKCSMKRQGIGSVLLETAENAIRARGIRYVSTRLGGKEYFEARFFYPKHGYSEEEPRLMRKALF